MDTFTDGLHRIDINIKTLTYEQSIKNICKFYKPLHNIVCRGVHYEHLVDLKLLYC